ncbi:CBS domain-containing protein [Candidatus Saccharibacteria bacterium]|nr:CBS domain-containing protein [Candidatus Saccharibacteria bacterium]
MVYVLILIYIVMVIVFGARPLRSSMSQFELERRAKKGNKSAADILAREQLLPDVMVLRNLKLALLTILFVCLAYVAYDFVMALLLTGLVWLSLEPINKIGIVKQSVNKLYQRVEPTILKYVAKVTPVFKFFHTVGRELVPKVGSKEELAEIVANLDAEVIPVLEQTALLELLDSSDKQVKDIMIPAKQIETVKADELLGPLVLDKLHGTGFSCFPVTDKDINHVVGVLNIKDLLDLDSKKSVKAKTAMVGVVHFISQDYSLARALSAAIDNNAQFMVVIDENRKTTGLLTLRDIVTGILGKDILKIDIDDDELVVSSTNKTYNSPPGGVDL